MAPENRERRVMDPFLDRGLLNEKAQVRGDEINGLDV